MSDKRTAKRLVYKPTSYCHTTRRWPEEEMAQLTLFHFHRFSHMLIAKIIIFIIITLIFRNQFFTIRRERHSIRQITCQSVQGRDPTKG